MLVCVGVCWCVLVCVGVSCFGAAGASHNSPRTPNVHISGPRRFKHHQNSTRRPPRKNERKLCWEREKKREILITVVMNIITIRIRILIIIYFGFEKIWPK